MDAYQELLRMDSYYNVVGKEEIGILLEKINGATPSLSQFLAFSPEIARAHGDILVSHHDAIPINLEGSQ